MEEASLTKSIILFESFFSKVFGPFLFGVIGFVMGRVVLAGLTGVLQLVGKSKGFCKDSLFMLSKLKTTNIFVKSVGLVHDSVEEA